MSEFVFKVIGTGEVASLWNSGNWPGEAWWLPVVSDFATFGASLALAGLTAYFVIRRPSLPFPRTVGLFCAFVVACGTVALMDALVLWWPVSRLHGLVNAGTAAISWVTVVAVFSVARARPGLPRRNEADQASWRLASVVESLEEPLISTTAEGVIATWNSAAERTFQYAASEAIGRNVSTLVGREGDEAAREWLGAIKSGMRSASFETVLCGKDGKSFDASLVISEVRDRAGETDGASILVRDITQRKQVEESLKQKEQRLRESQKLEAVGALAGGVAHEFNNLLQAIQGYTQYAMEGLSSEGRRYRDLQQVLEASERAKLLVRQLLNFGRRHKIERVEFDVNALVADTEAMLRPLIGEQIELHIDLCPRRVVVEGDWGLLQQTLSNLCINARDAMPEGGRLCIRTEQVALNEAYCEAHVGVKPGDYAVLTIADTGQGISKEVSGHIFEPFFTTKEVGKGTGLALAMVYGVVQQHGGVIHVYSEPGQGATFKIYLPAVAARQEAREAETGSTCEAETGSTREAETGSTCEAETGSTCEPETGSTCEPETGGAREGSETVLLAEDEPMVRDLVARILRGAGYSVKEASNGMEAIEVFQADAEAISLALLDVVMPYASGRAVYERIKHVRPQTKVVFCTGYDPETGQADFASQEGLRLIQKPVDPDVLLRTIREVLDDKEPCHMMQTTS